MVREIPVTKTIISEDKYAKISIDIYNKRIKIIENNINPKELLRHIDEYRKSYDVEKVIYIAPSDKVSGFMEEGFIEEAQVKKILRGKNGSFISKYLSKERKQSKNIDEEDKIIMQFKEISNVTKDIGIGSEYVMRDATEEDVEEMSKVFSKVFQTYPTPMEDSNYIKKVMKENVLFKVILYKDKIVSIASAEMDQKNANAELTDCATLPNHRGNGLMSILIKELEKEMKKRKFFVLYTMARAISYGINIAFFRNGYEYCGRMIKNCNICGQFEDMNILYKEII